MLGALALGGASARVIFVDRSAFAQTPDGKTWETAYTGIQPAAAAAEVGDEIWVAQGDYQEGITISDGGIGLYGGFAGTETSRDQRDPRAHVSRIVVGWLRTSNGADTQPITISGFTFSNCAAGLTLNSAATVVSDIVITACSGSTVGVAIAAHGTVTVTKTVITGNWTGTTGTVFVYQDAVATISNCTITGNQAIQGAGIYVQGTATIANSLIANNASYSRGGGIYVGPNGTATIVNNTLAANSASNGDGAGLFVDGTATVANNIVVNNDTGIGTSSPSLTLQNNDVFGNIDWDYKGIADPTGSGGNISGDPLFAADGDFHILAGSPCIDAGNDSLVTAGAIDLDGKQRISGAHVDMGAYEIIGAAPFTMLDVGHALRIAGGLDAALPSDLTLLNVEVGGDSATAIDLFDAVRLARKVAGLEPNP